MPGMWELPRIAGKANGMPLLTVRHSITTTNWLVRVFHHPRVAADVRQRWIRLRNLPQLPLTGLTRKILRKLDLLA